MNKKAFERVPTCGENDVDLRVASAPRRAVDLTGAAIIASQAGQITDLTAEVTNLASKLAEAQARPWVKLWDTQWMNIVNHAHAYDGWSTEDAVHHAVKMTEEQCRLNNAAHASAQAVPVVASGPTREQLMHAAIDCGHIIEGNKITLYRHDKNDGNALSQMADRLVAVCATPTAAKVSARAADAPSEPMSKDLEWLIQCADEARFDPELATTLRNNVKNGIKYRAADALGSQPTETAVPNGWISVMDQLPGIGREVNVYCPNKDNEYRRVTALCRLIRYEGATEFYWDNCYGGSNIHLQESVTHWMPLPPAPASSQPTVPIALWDDNGEPLNEAAEQQWKASSQPTDGEVRNG